MLFALYKDIKKIKYNLLTLIFLQNYPFLTVKNG